VTEFARVLDNKVMKEMGRKGGSSRSEAKRESAKRNLARANEVKKLKRLGPA
jgi:hypothetical protein